MSEKTIAYYMNLPYTIEIVHDTSSPLHSVWFVSVEELPGCMTEVDSFEEAGAMIRDTMLGWFEVALARGILIPEPEQPTATL